MANYLFIDMHMHSKYSNEDLCDESPKHIFSKVQKYVNDFNTTNGTNVDCCISITDHNSMMACVDARKLVNSGLYPNVKFINGCEFTTDLCEINNAIGLKNCFTRCHVLAYGFDENNKELQAYSKVTHKRFSNEDNIGLQILAARRAICETFGVYIPFSKFERLAWLGQNDDYFTPFYAIVKDFFKENKLKFDSKEVNDCITHYILGPRNYVEEATSYGRLKLSEVSKLIKDAGGKMVLAHPSIIKVGVAEAEKFMEKYKIEKPATLVSIKERNKKRDTLFKFGPECTAVVLKEILNATNKVCNGATFDGMETMIGINFFKRTDKEVENICKRNNLFQTAGSDYHGENFATHKTIGNCFEQEMQREFGIINTKIQDRNLFVRVSNLPAVDYFIENKPIEKFEAEFIDETFNSVMWKDIDECMNMYKQKEKEKRKLKKLNQVQEEIKKNIENLTFIAESYTKILNKGTDIKQRRKLIFNLEKFCHSIYKGLQTLQKNFREHSENYDVEDVKRITTLLKELHRKYYEMVRLDNGAAHYVKMALKSENGIRTTTLDRIANITMKEKYKEK